jgi:hypothetical protein
MAPNATTDPTMGANNKIENNERVIASWESESLPDLLAMSREWQRVDPAGLDEGLLQFSLSNLLYMENPYSYKKFQ